MARLRQLHDPGGGTYFFTLRLAQRGDDVLLRRIPLLRQALRETLARRPFHIDAIAVLPDAIHTVWTLPAQDGDYAKRIGMWKARFSKHLPPPPHRSLRQIKRGEKGIWQRRFWEHKIQGAADFERHRDLVHLSPVHAGFCQRPEDWPFSSIHRERARVIEPAFEVLEEEVPPVLQRHPTHIPPEGLHS